MALTAFRASCSSAFARAGAPKPMSKASAAASVPAAGVQAKCGVRVFMWKVSVVVATGYRCARVRVCSRMHANVRNAHLPMAHVPRHPVADRGQRTALRQLTLQRTLHAIGI